VTAPFVTIRPAMTGTFRWSGTTILIFTPDPARKLPKRHPVRGHGRHVSRGDQRPRLAARVPIQFHDADRQAFSASTGTARTNGTTAPWSSALRFNQPVRPADVTAHMKLRFEPHEFETAQSLCRCAKPA
jgi:hypothetical protein